MKNQLTPQKERVLIQNSNKDQFNNSPTSFGTICDQRSINEIKRSKQLYQARLHFLHELITPPIPHIQRIPGPHCPDGKTLPPLELPQPTLNNPNNLPIIRTFLLVLPNPRVPLVPPYFLRDRVTETREVQPKVPPLRRPPGVRLPELGDLRPELLHEIDLEILELPVEGRGEVLEVVRPVPHQLEIGVRRDSDFLPALREERERARRRRAARLVHHRK